MVLKKFDEWVEDESVYTYNNPCNAFFSSISISKLDVGDALIPEPDGKYVTTRGETVLLYGVDIQTIAKALRKSYFEALIELKKAEQ